MSVDTTASLERTPTDPPRLSGGRPVLGHAVEFLREPVGLLERGQREHGKVFGIRLFNQPAVVLLSPEYHRLFFAETDARLSIRSAYPYFVRMFDREFYFFAPFEEYQRQRALVLPRFRGTQLDKYVDVMAAETAALIERLGDEGEFDLVQRLGPLVMHIAAHAFLGAGLRESMSSGFFELFRRFSAGMDPVWPGWLPLPHLIRSRRARDRLRRLVIGLIQERRAHPLDPPDFLQLLCGATFDDGEPVPDLVLVNLILMLTWAGHETTTGHVSWAVIDLLQHPEELAKVRAEVLDSDAPLSMKLIHRMSHLDRALHETERLHPVAFSLVRHAATEFDIDGYRVPKGSMVVIAPSVAHRLPEQYPDPDAYRPDRYLDNPRAMQELIGFGGGTHRCLGVHFAYLEMKVIVAMLLRAYDLELVDPDPRPMPGAKTKWPQSPCRVRYRRR